MRPVLTPTEMGAADAATIDAGTPGSVLMDRAGRAVAWAVRRRAGTTYGLRVLVVCGKGNNGGDGRIAAQSLARWGAKVTCVDVSDRLDRDAVLRELDRGAVVIDAMFGTGFSGRLEGDAAWVAETMAASGVPVVAIDIPSGVDGLTGAVDGPAVRAEVTVVMAALKTGLTQEPGRSHAGAIEVVDIGIDPGSSSIGMTEPGDVAGWVPPASPDANKWSAGLLVVGGSDGMTGAPMFVSHAAMRVGAGIVWCGVPGVEAARTASGTEVITRALADRDGNLAPGAVAAVLEDTRRFPALVVGPGLGRDEGTAAAVRGIVEGASGSLVIDADGLNAFEGDPDALRSRPPGTTVLTPHGGEYARLAGHEVGPDRIASARELAATTGAIVLLKGPGTVIAAPDGRTAVNPTGTPALATAGSGDVLSGVIGGLLARGVSAFEAAAAGAYLHGSAAEAVASDGSPDGSPDGPVEGLVASDLLDALPRTLASVRSTATSPFLVPENARDPRESRYQNRNPGWGGRGG